MFIEVGSLESCVVTGVLALVVLLLCSVCHWRGFRAYWAIWRLPGFSKIPLIGDTIYLGTAKLEDIFYEMMTFARNNRMNKANLLGIPIVVFHHPDDVEALLGSTTNITKGFEYFPLRPWLREGLLLSDGLKWHQRRKLLTPTFHFNILESNVGQMAGHIKVFIDKLLETAGKPIVLDDLVRQCTLDVICETAMGVELNSQESKSTDYVQAIKRCSDAICKRVTEVWLYREWVFWLTAAGKVFHKDLKTLHQFTEKVISIRKGSFTGGKENGEEKKKRKAFMDLLLETEEKNPGILSASGIQEEVDTFMFEGHDTTSSAIVHSLYVMGQHPEIQERLYEEQLQIFGSETRDPTKQDLQEMQYLEMFIKEVLRLYPSVPYISRRITHELKLGNGVTLPPGVNVIIMPFTLHRNEEFWDDPEEFRPERFLPGTSRHPYSYVPFSAGPRNCIGTKFAMLELKCTLSAVVRHCLIEPVTKELRLMPNVILKNVVPIQARVLPRQK